MSMAFRTMARQAAAVVCVSALSLAVVGCERGGRPASQQPTAPTAAATTGPPTPAPSTIAGGCGSTSILLGSLPDWATSAGVPGPSRFVMAHEGNLLGVLFGERLVAPPLTNGPSNKILWISREPRDGSSLTLSLTTPAAGAPVTVTQPADSSPGQIYPSIVDVPVPGCWGVVAEWAGHRATLELSYGAQ